MAITLATATKFEPNANQLVGNLATKVAQAYWELMEELLTANDTASARVNAIVRLNEAMDEAILAAQELDNKFHNDHSNGYFTE